jgi:hypothetical protein
MRRVSMMSLLVALAMSLGGVALSGCGGGAEQAEQNTPASCPHRRPPQRSHWWRKAHNK